MDEVVKNIFQSAIARTVIYAGLGSFERVSFGVSVR